MTDRKLKDTVSLLDFATILKTLHTRTLPIRPVSKTTEYKRLMHQMAHINAEFKAHEQQVKRNHGCWRQGRANPKAFAALIAEQS